MASGELRNYNSGRHFVVTLKSNMRLFVDARQVTIVCALRIDECLLCCHDLVVLLAMQRCNLHGNVCRFKNSFSEAQLPENGANYTNQAWIPKENHSQQELSGSNSPAAQGKSQNYSS